MSETLTETVTKDQEYRAVQEEMSSADAAGQLSTPKKRESSGKPEPNGELTEVPAHVRPLFDFVVANAEEVRAWPWINGATMRLGDAIKLHPLTQDYLLPEQVSVVMDDVLKGLAQEPASVEGSAQEAATPDVETEVEEPEQEQPAVAIEDVRSNKKVQEQQKPAPQSVHAEARAPKEVPAEQVQKPVARPAETSQQTSASVATEVPAPNKPAGTAKNKVEVTTPSADESPAKNTAVELKAEQKPIKQLDSPIDGPLSELVEESLAEIEEAEQVLFIKDEPKPNDYEVVARDETAILPAETAPVAELEVLEIIPLEPAEIIETIEDNIEPRLDLEQKDGLEFEADYETKEAAVDFVEDEIIFLNADVTDLESNKELPSSLKDETNALDLVEADVIESVAQLSLPIQEIETALIQVAEGINDAEPETVEAVNGILDKIVEVSQKFQAIGSEITGETEAQEELEELFIQLFDRLGISYQPELIESLAYLTLKWHLSDEIEKLKEKEPGRAAQGSGTHEIIKKLLAGLSVIKKAIDRAGVIGESALRLYIFSSATASA